MAKKLTKPIALFFTVFAVLVAALLHFGALDLTTSAAWDGNIAETFDGGDGSEASPFEIANGEQLAYLAQEVNRGTTYNDAYFKLTANIDLGGKEWTPIGGEDNYFEGTFDGGRHTVSNFKINKPEDNYIGLFGYNNGTIMNLGVEKAEISGSYYVGGVCGYNDGVTIQNCYNTGAVSGTENVGGMCGYNCGTHKSTIENCYNTGAVSGNGETSSAIGGVCGYNDYDGTIQNCYNTGAVSGSEQVGGVCGNNNYSGTIKNCYNTGSVSGNGETSSAIGGVCGYRQGGTIANCYYNTDFCAVGGINGSDVDGSATGLTTAELCNGSLPYSTFNSSIWEVGSSSEVKKGRLKTVKYTYPSLKGVGTAVTVSGEQTYDFSLTADGTTYEEFTPVTTADEFKALKNTLSGNYVLMADINLKNAEIDPLGKSSFNAKFKFSGNGHTISNFKINKPDEPIVGLFDRMDTDSLIMNLAVENGEIIGGSCVGGICGYSNNPIYSCSFDGKVTGTSDNSTVGGICGRVYLGKVINCFSSAEVTGEGSVGGVVGENSKGSMQYCISVGTVIGGESSKMGGVAGSKGSSATIDHCYYDYEVCKVPNDVAVGGTMSNDPETTHVNSATTWALCYGDNTTVEPFTNSGLWEAGSVPSDDSVGNIHGRFGKKIYTYIHLKDIGTAKTIDVSVYNFSEYIDNPEWKTYTPISTAAEFQKITDLSKNYVLGADIDLGGEEITPIGNLDKPFTGKFSGNGHTVSNFKINKRNESYIGLFGYNNGTIMNLGVEKAEINGYNLVGGVCGYNNNGAIQKCYNTGAVSGTASNIGGVCGSNSNTIEDCYNTGTVSGETYVGGVCGNNYGAIQKCYNTGAVSGTASNIGGVCGNNDGTIEDCYNTGAVKGEYSVGGVCGFNGGTITNCYYNTDFCTVGGIGGSDVDGSATGLTTLQMTDVNALDTMGFEKTIWQKNGNDTKNGIAYYPSLKESGYQPSVKFTQKLELELVGDKTPVYGDKIEFRTKALLSFKNDFGGENITVEDTAGVFEVKVDRETLSVTDSKFEYTANTAGEVTFTLVYKSGSSDYFPEEYSEDVVVTIEMKELTAADFTFAPAADLKFDNTAKEVTVTAIPDGVGEITVKYYAGDNETQPINAGDYTVKIDVAKGDFYKPAQDLTAADWTFTIAKGTQAITADDVTLTYGETAKITASTNGDGAISYAVKTGADVISVAADGTITALKAGTATVEITAAETSNCIQATKTVNVTVNKAAVTITAKNYTIKVGAALPDFDYEVTGLANGEALPIDVTISCTADGKTAGEFPITVSGAADSDNYTFSYTNGTLIVSNKETQTITADDVTLTYGETAKITASTDGDGAISYAVKTGADVISVAADGTITVLKAGTATVEITAAETDTYAKAVKAVTVTVNKAAVKITAKSYTIKVGDNLPDFDYEVTGLANGEKLPIKVTISCTADGKTAGEFPIMVSGAADSDNYTFSYTNGTLIVSNKETQTITADDVTLTYGETGKITASTDGDGAISYAVTAGSDVISAAADGTITVLKSGTATVEITAAETDTYAKAVKAVTVTVNKAAVTITAKNYAIKVGDNLPDFDYEVTGLANGETLPITVTISCTAADSNTAGTFPITVSGAADSDNYTFSYLNGTLTIGEKEPVSTPVFSPASGTTFTSSQKITITCATEGAAIYYTTDGTEPTTASTLYNGAFTITATTTIKAIAVKEGMSDSAVATAAYTKRSSSGSSGGTGGGSSRPTTPTEPENPSIGGSAKSWSDIAADLAKLADGSEVTIQLNGNTSVPADVIKKIADTDSKVTFVIDSVFTWVVDGAKITVPAAADLSFIRTASQKHDCLRGIEGTQFRINNTGVPAGLEIAFKSEHAGKFANLYKSVDGKLVFVTCAKLGADGKVLLPGVTEKGDYIAMLCAFSDLPGDMSNDGTLNAMDASAILKDIVGLESGANPLMADFNGDGNVNAMDASVILKRIVGLI